jgi:adenylate cyclase
MQRRLAAILSSDLVGFSRLVARSEESTLRRLTEQRHSIIDPLLERHRGRIFKTMGDGLLVEFASAVDAVRYALSQQEKVTASEARIAAEERLIWRIAIHLGDVVVEGDDLVGDGVNVVSRLQSLAPPGGVLVSQTIRDQLPGSFISKPAGTHRLKNIPKPVPVFEVLKEDMNASVSPARNSLTSILQRPAARLGLAVCAIALIAAGLWLSGGILEPISSLLRSPLPGETGEMATMTPQIVVMPLTTTGDEGREALIAGGLTDEIIGGLSKFSGIRVFGRNTSEALQKAALSPSELRQKHRVRYVVSGAMRLLDDKFRLNFELIDTDTGSTRWAEHYETDIGGAFEALNSVVASIVSNVAAKVSRTELEAARQRPPANLTAFELMLRGRQLWQRPSKENIAEARSLFQQAIEADPGFAPPLAYMAFTYLTAYNNKWSDEYEDPAALDRMLELANRALEIDPSYATGYAAQAIAYTYQGRHDEADSAAARAIAANSNDPDVLGRAAQVLSFSGRHLEAIELLNKAIDLDPFGPAQWFNFLSRAHFFLGQNDPAIAFARTCLDRSKLQPCRETLAAALALSGNFNDAAKIWRELTETDPTMKPERIVARLRPAFRRQSDLDRLVEGLTKAGGAPRP